LGKTSALRFENIKFFKKPALYALKTLNFKLTLPSLAYQQQHIQKQISLLSLYPSTCGYWYW
jgi:hypothetical protein